MAPSRPDDKSPAPYGSGPQPVSGALSAGRPAARVRIHHLAAAKERGEHFAMLTAYDQYAAQIFDEAGIEVLLVGDSAANNVFGHETSLPVTTDDLLPLCRAVARSARHALVVADLPFGSYETSPAQGVETGVRFLKEGLAHAVKMEGGAYYADTVRAMVQAGIPVMAHIGFTPQSEHALGGYRVQGRGDDAARLIGDAKALEAAGAFCVLMEMVPAVTAAAVDAAVSVPTIGIGAGASTTGQVLVWQDMAGLRGGEARGSRSLSSSTRICAGRSWTPPAVTATTCARAPSPGPSTASDPPRLQHHPNTLRIPDACNRSRALGSTDPMGEFMTLRPQKIWLALVGERVQVRLGTEVVDADIVDAVTPDDALLWLAQEGVRARRIVERGSGYSMWATCKWESESAATNGST